MYYSNFKQIEHEICALDEPAAGPLTNQPTLDYFKWYH